MLLEKATSLFNRLINSSWFLVALFVALFLLTRLPYLGQDSINPDAVNWHYRSEQFIDGLKAHQWERTYQYYHPGVTLMWIMGVAIEIVRQIEPSLRVYNQENFILMHTVAKYAVVFAQLMLSLGLIWLFKKLFDLKKAVLLVGFFSLEPFFIGNSRLLHMDVLLSLFLLISLVLAYISAFPNEKFSRWYVFASGVFLAFSFLTKSISIGGLPFILAFLVFCYFNQPKELLRQIFFFLMGFFLAVFVFFPATWVAPIDTITKIFTEAERIGIRKGHEQIYFGQETIDPGLTFYPVLIFLKTSPILFIGLLLFTRIILRHLGVFALTAEKSRDLPRIILSRFNSLLPIKGKNPMALRIILTIFYLGYMATMTISSKKIDRYLIPIFPLLCLFSFIGYEKTIPQKYQKPFLILSTMALLSLNFAFHPYQFTYFTPLVGSPENAHYIVAQKPFGIGIPNLKNQILSKYGTYEESTESPKLGFYDTKPMSRIYKSSHIFDIREFGPSNYDIVVLGPNEKVPDELNDQFDLDFTMKINGLNYWRVYVKNRL